MNYLPAEYKANHRKGGILPFRETITAFTTTIAMALVAAPVTAITTQSAAAQTAESYSTQELDAFTTALFEVASVREKYSPVLRNAETEDQKSAIVEEANAEIRNVIEKTDGMTLDSYLEIAKAASEDQALNQRIVKRVQSMTETSQ